MIYDQASANIGFSPGYAAQLLGLDYQAALRLMRKENGLAVTENGRLIVPATWLLRFSAYKDWLKTLPSSPAARSQNYAIPKPQRAIWASRAEMKKLLPLQWLYNMEDLRLKGMDDEQIAVEKPGWVETSMELDRLLMRSSLRAQTKSGRTTFLLNDIHDVTSWASMAERSWWTGWRQLMALIKERAQMPSSKVALLPSAPVPKPQDEGRGRRAEVAGLPVVPGIRLITPPEVRYASSSVHFTFEPKMGLGTPAMRSEYLAAMPLEFLERAATEALAWAELLLEERTSYHRALRGMTEDQFHSNMDAMEAKIYVNRRAWESGVLVPLMPAGHKFLF